MHTMSLKYFTTIILITILTGISMDILQCQANADLYHYNLEDIPNFCNFFDTIDITRGILNPDLTITFDGIQFAQQDYAIFDYKYLSNHVKIAVLPHTRGCICKYKPCIRFCCLPGHSFYDINVGTGLKHHCQYNRNLSEMQVNVLQELDAKEIDVLKHKNLTIISKKPCKMGYFLEPDDPTLDDYWQILSNGTLVVGENMELVQHNKYCLAHAYNPSSDEFTIKALYCTEKEPERSLAKALYPAMMLVSVVFYLLTLFVYIWIEELRSTIHGKNLMCYLATLIIGYSSLAYIQIEQSNVNVHGQVKCLVLAEIIHTAFIGGFLWLNVISYDIWRTIGRTFSYSHGKQFLRYCIFVLSLTILIVLITNGLDHVDWFDDKFKPGLGISNCWLQDTKYANFLYLYAIIIIIICINTVFFTLTKMKIEWVKRIAAHVCNSEDSRKFAREDNDADHFGLCLRLFIIMGIQWITEIISWILDGENICIYILDAVTMMQGPFIFFLFIRNKRIKMLVKRKLSVRNSVTTVSTTIKLEEIK